MRTDPVCLRVTAASVATGLSFVLSACSTTPYSSETSALTQAAASFKSTVTASSPIPAANASLAKAAYLAGLVKGSPPPLSADCSAAVEQWNSAFVNAVSDQANSEDAEFKKLSQIPPCGPFALSPDNTTPPATQKGDLVSALDSYFDALQAIVSAKDYGQLTTAVNAAKTSLDTLEPQLSKGKTPEAATDFAASLANLAIQDAQYRALKKYVFDVDPLLDGATPTLISAMRLQQAYWATQVAWDAHAGMLWFNSMWTTPQVRADLQVRFQLYDRTSAILSEFSQEQAAVATDPGVEVRALVEAHHKLAAALKSNRGELRAVMSSVSTIASGAQAMSGASATAGAAKPKPGS